MTLDDWITLIIDDNTNHVYTREQALEIFMADTVLFIGGMCFATVLLVFSIARLLDDVYISPTIKEDEDLALVHIIDEKSGQEFTYLNPSNFSQTIGMIASFVVWRKKKPHKKDSYLLHNRNKALFCTWLLLLLLIAVACLGLYFMFTFQ